MKTQTAMILATIAFLLSMMTGCDENKRLAEQAERHAQRQAEQSQRTAELQREVATVQKEAQIGQNELGRERDKLEEERRQFASTRYLDPIVANSISNVGLLLICVLPLVVCWQLLNQHIDPADDGVIAEMLLEDMVAESPILLTASQRPALAYSGEDDDSEPHHNAFSQPKDQTCHT